MHNTPRIFAAFDFEEMRVLIEDICALEGYLCASCGDLELIPGWLHWLRPDAMVFDADFIGERLGSLRIAFPDTTFIAVVSSASRTMLERMEEHNVFEVLNHPLSLNALVSALKRVKISNGEADVREASQGHRHCKTRTSSHARAWTSGATATWSG